MVTMRENNDGYELPAPQPAILWYARIFGCQVPSSQLLPPSRPWFRIWDLESRLAKAANNDLGLPSSHALRAAGCIEASS